MIYFKTVVRYVTPTSTIIIYFADTHIHIMCMSFY